MTLRRLLIALLAGCLALLSPGLTAQAADPDAERSEAAQVLNWTADNNMHQYKSQPSTAVAGATTIVFENSAATGNTTGMTHTLTFDTSTPGYNHDVAVNLTASPNDAQGGKWQVDVNLTPGKYRFFCAIPGHEMMTGELIVTDGGPDTTPPETKAEVTGNKDTDGNYVASATVNLAATDAGSGVDRIDYAVDGGEYAAYEAPVVVNTVGDHTVKYRATDKAGNVEAEKSVAFKVVEAPGGDATPPEVSAEVTGEKNSAGYFKDMATVTITAKDNEGGSGVGKIEYSIGGGAFTTYTAPFMVHALGTHTVTYKATDKAGNAAEPKTVTFTIAPGNPNPDPNCAENDDRPIVFVGEETTGVPNRVTGTGCKINEVIQDEKAWPGHARFVKHVKELTTKWRGDGVLDQAEKAEIDAAAQASTVGVDGKGYKKIFDGTQDTFGKWEQVGGGSFGLNGDGSMTSGTAKGGLGMLWYPAQKYGDFSLKLQFRDDAPSTNRANSGVFVRFPQPHDFPGESRPEWVAIKYGHEVQIFDGDYGDQYKTGSLYGFDVNNLGEGMATDKGVWNDYEIKVVGQHYSVYRNGILINEFENSPGQLFSPPRSDDPGTDGRQRVQGYVGLQVHGTTDVISYRDVRIKAL
ncbi:OmpL47-type beta-barrel domain-containing protein [Streptomyces boninensis]|uniref:OmpL47-type beta-barrel domain-containing protein n=1 Tax=Streptomyces boninensis TaxID=2039455 RepID=UPI003B2214E4